MCQSYSKPTVGRFLRHGVDHRSFRSDCTDTQIRPVAVRTVPLCGNVKLAALLTVPYVTAHPRRTRLCTDRHIAVYIG